MGGDIARLDPGALKIYDGGTVQRNCVYYCNNRDQKEANPYEALCRDMLRLLSRGWQPWGITREELRARLLDGLERRLYQDTWLWELSIERLNYQLSEYTQLPFLRVVYLPAADLKLLDKFIARIEAGDRPAGFIGSGGSWMYPDRLQDELRAGTPGLAHKLGHLFDLLRRKHIPTFGICLSFQIMAEQTWGRGTNGNGDFLVEYLHAPSTVEYEYHNRTRLYSRVQKGKPAFIFGVRTVRRVEQDPLMHWIDETPALVLHGMGVRIPNKRVPPDAVLAACKRHFSKKQRRNPGLHRPDRVMWDTSYDILQAARFGPVMRGTQFHPELTPAFCVDLSRHPRIACMLTDMPPERWPSESDYIRYSLECFINREELDRLAVMQREIEEYPWDKFVVEPKPYVDSPRGKRYPAGASAAYNFCKFFFYPQYIVETMLDGHITDKTANEILGDLLTANQKPLVQNILTALGITADLF